MPPGFALCPPMHITEVSGQNSESMMLSSGLALCLEAPRGHFFVQSRTLVLETGGLGLGLAQWSCLDVNAQNSNSVTVTNKRSTHGIDTLSLTDCVVDGNDIRECHAFAKMFNL